MRVARLIQPGVVHHVISRFVDRSWELRDDVERAMYLRLLGRAIAASDWRCLAFALMSSHVHLAVIPGNNALGAVLKRVHSPFANWLNARHARLGPVFADRPAAWAIRGRNETRLIAYIHTNPVRAGVVKRALDSSWTSHRAYCGVVESPPWLDVADGLRRCGVAADHFDAQLAATSDEMPRPSLGEMQRAAHRFGALELATPTDDPLHVPLVARSFARIRPDAMAIVRAVSATVMIPHEHFCSRARSRSGDLVRARHLTILVATRLGLGIAETSAALGITRQAGSLLAARPVDELMRASATVTCARLTNLTPSPLKSA